MLVTGLVSASGADSLEFDHLKGTVSEHKVADSKTCIFESCYDVDYGNTRSTHDSDA